MNDTHYYEVNLHWNKAVQGTLSAPNYSVSSDIKPKGTKEKWTPEHLFVVAVNSCLMSSFLLVTDKSSFQFISFESKAIGKIEKVNGELAVTEVCLKSVLIIPPSQNKAMAKRVLAISEKACAIANSLRTKITSEPVITIN